MSCGCVAFSATKATLPSWPHRFQHSDLTTLPHCSTTTSRITYIGVSKGILAQLIPAACAGGVECTDFCQARSNHKISQVLTFRPCMDLIICYVRYQNAQTEECLRMENAGETQGGVALVRDLSRDRSPCAECSALASRRPCSWAQYSNMFGCCLTAQDGIKQVVARSTKRPPHPENSVFRGQRWVGNLHNLRLLKPYTLPQCQKNTWSERALTSMCWLKLYPAEPPEDEYSWFIGGQ